MLIKRFFYILLTCLTSISFSLFGQNLTKTYRFFGETSNKTYNECVGLKVVNHKGIIVPIPCIRDVERILLEIQDKNGKPIKSNPFYAQYSFNLKNGYVLIVPERELTGVFASINDLSKGYTLQKKLDKDEFIEAMVYKHSITGKGEFRPNFNTTLIEYFDGRLQEVCLNKNDSISYLIYNKIGQNGDLGGPITLKDRPNVLFGIILGMKNTRQDFGVQISDEPFITNEDLKEYHYSFLEEILTVKKDGCPELYFNTRPKEYVNSGKIDKRIILGVHKKAVNNLFELLIRKKEKDNKTQKYYNRFFADRARYGQTAVSVVQGYNPYFRDNHPRIHELIHYLYRFEYEAFDSDKESTRDSLIVEIERLDQSLIDKSLSSFEEENFSRYGITNKYLFEIKFELLRKPEYYELLKKVKELVFIEEYIKAEITRVKASQLHKNFSEDLEYKKIVLDSSKAFINRRIDSAAIEVKKNRLAKAKKILDQPRKVDDYLGINDSELDSMLIVIDQKIFNNKKEKLNGKKDELESVATQVSKNLDILYEEYKSNTRDVFHFVWKVRREGSDLNLELEVSGSEKKNSFGIKGNAETENFPKGKYTSSALKKFFKTVIIPSLREVDNDIRFILNSDSTSIKITGTADALKFRGSLQYNNEFGAIELKTKDENKKLAKVRGLLARWYLMNADLDFLSDKSSYSVEGLPLSQIGPQYRKVIISIKLKGFTKSLENEIDQLEEEITE